MILVVETFIITGKKNVSTIPEKRERRFQIHLDIDVVRLQVRIIKRVNSLYCQMVSCHSFSSDGIIQHLYFLGVPVSIVVKSRLTT